MILYFTGSGNTKYIADALAERLGETEVSLNDVLKFGKEKKFNSETPFIILAPIYAWRIPRIIENLISEAEFTGNKKIYFVVTMGSQSGKATEYCKKIAENKGMEFMGLRGIAMPDNYVIASKMADSEKIRKFLDDAIPQADEIAAAIKNGEKIFKTDKTPLSSLMSGLVNDLFLKFVSSDKKFAANEKCISCGLCEKLCPVNNIQMKADEDGKLKPSFSGHCLSCYSCIHHCPTQALNITGKTEKHGRYVCPEYRI